MQPFDALNRRQFLAGLAGTAVAGFTLGDGKSKHITLDISATAVTTGPKHHFFGYYDKCPWDATGRYILAGEIGFIDRQPKAGETLGVGMVDLKNGKQFEKFDDTAAWSWQQGTMLQWLGSDPERSVIYNAVDDGQYVSVIRDVFTGKTRTLPRPIYAMSSDGRHAVTLDYARLHRLRPGYGYATLPEQHANDAAPEKLGVFHLDIATGKDTLIVPLSKLAQIKPPTSFKDSYHWVNHLQFNPSGNRFLFLHRWRVGTNRWSTRLLVAKPDGSDLKLVIDTGMVSHFDWKDDTTILAWSQTPDRGQHFYLFDINGDEPTILGGDVLTRDGHCSYSPDRNWVLNDTYPDRERNQTLMLFHPATGRRIDLNKFYLPPKLTGPFRCDLHPRWNRDGTEVCIDSAHEPTRQMYVLDVSEVVKG